MTTIAISGEMNTQTLNAIKEQILKINQNLVIKEIDGYAAADDETITALKNSQSVGNFKSFDEFESGVVSLDKKDADDLRQKYQKLMSGEMELCSFDEVNAYLDKIIEK